MDILYKDDSFELKILGSDIQTDDLSNFKIYRQVVRHIRTASIGNNNW